MKYWQSLFAKNFLLFIANIMISPSELDSLDSIYDLSWLFFRVLSSIFLRIIFFANTPSPALGCYWIFRKWPANMPWIVKKMWMGLVVERAGLVVVWVGLVVVWAGLVVVWVERFIVWLELVNVWVGLVQWEELLLYYQIQLYALC